MYGVPAPKPSPVQATLSAIWKDATRGTYVMPPSICLHDVGWHHLDVNLAACRSCGFVHACRDGVCEMLGNEEGYSVCTITGCIVKNISYAVDEYTDTTQICARVLSSAGAPLCSQPTAMNGILSETIYGYCVALLDGPLWRKCIDAEHDRLASSRETHFIKAVKGFKMKHPNCYPDVYSATCAMVFNTKGLRCSTPPSESCRRKLAELCAEAIGRHIFLLNRLVPGTVLESKLQFCVTGLVYLMRMGVVCHDTVILPKHPLLCTSLPLENTLDTVFGIKSKCITEMENVVKSTMRGARMSTLVNIGIHGVDRGWTH
jgi:hypothetical protein